MSRTCKRSRIADSVRPCLSAISVTLFPASTNSRSRFSSSGSHRRLALRAPLIIRPAVLRDADLSGQARARRRSYRAPLADVPRSASRRGVRAQYIPPGCAWRPQWHVSVSPGRGYSYVAQLATWLQVRCGQFVPAGTTLKSLNWSFGPLRWWPARPRS